MERFGVLLEPGYPANSFFFPIVLTSGGLAPEAVGVVEGLVGLACDPQTVQQHRELASDSHHHRAPLGVLASAPSNLQAVSSEVRVLPKGTEDVVGAANQQFLSISSPRFEMCCCGSHPPD